MITHISFQLLNLLPYQSEKDLEPLSERDDRRLQYISLGIKWTMAVSDKKRHRRRGHPALHLLVKPKYQFMK